MNNEMTNDQITAIAYDCNALPEVVTDKTLAAFARAVIAADRAQQAAEIERLRKDAARYQWLKKHPQWLGWEHDFRPDEVEREIDAAMKETP